MKNESEINQASNDLVLSRKGDIRDRSVFCKDIIESNDEDGVAKWLNENV